MEAGVYIILNNTNNNIYIGSTNNIKRRWDWHKNQLKKNKHGNKYLQRAYNKYGKDNFSFEIVEYINTESLLLSREQKWLDFFNPEYNILKIAGSPLGYKHTEEAKKKISEAGKIKIFTQEHRDNLSKASKGKPNLKLKGTTRTEEVKNKIGKANKGRKMSDETKEKLRQINLIRQAEIRNKNK